MDSILGEPEAKDKAKRREAQRQQTAVALQ
jgi:hypothetical protein